MRKISFVAIGLLSAAVACFCGAPQAAKGAAPAHQRTAPPAPARLTDAQVEADIRARFARSKIDEDKFTVHVQGGVATIDGKTDVLQHKGVATRLAKSGGAAAVNNRVVVSDAAKKKAAANLEQGRRRVQVKRGESRSQNDRK